jgi:histone-lysine N-methyltransferase SETMAR
MYIDILRRLRDAAEGNVSQNWESTFFLFHDNAPAHRWVLVNDSIAKYNVTKREHPPYSPDLAPTDFYMFPWLKSVLKGRRFCDVIDIIKNATEELKGLSQNGC